MVIKNLANKNIINQFLKIGVMLLANYLLLNSKPLNCSLLKLKIRQNANYPKRPTF